MPLPTSRPAHRFWSFGAANGVAGASSFSNLNVRSGQVSWSATTSGVSVAATNWVYSCAAITGTAGASVGTATVFVNGVDRTTSGNTAFLPAGALGINANPRNSNRNAFGIAELVVWNLALSPGELHSASYYLSQKYCLANPSPGAAWSVGKGKRGGGEGG